MPVAESSSSTNRLRKSTSNLPSQIVILCQRTLASSVARQSAVTHWRQNDAGSPLTGTPCSVQHGPVTHDDETETIGQRLRRLRLERGFSQRELSGPGVSYAYISRIEAGARTPSVKALRMLARKLGVSVEYLETGGDLRDTDEREPRMPDAELELRLAKNVEAAESKLKAIVEEAKQAGDFVSGTRAGIALGLAASHRGNHLDAVERLEEALEGQPIPVAARPDAYAVLGQSYAALGAPDRAVRLFERCLQEVDEGAAGDSGPYIRFAAYLSSALGDAGDHERAKEVVREALARADEATDQY